MPEKRVRDGSTAPFYLSKVCNGGWSALFIKIIYGSIKINMKQYHCSWVAHPGNSAWSALNFYYCFQVKIVWEPLNAAIISITCAVHLINVLSIKTSSFFNCFGKKQRYILGFFRVYYLFQVRLPFLLYWLSGVSGHKPRILKASLVLVVRKKFSDTFSWVSGYLTVPNVVSTCKSFLGLSTFKHARREAMCGRVMTTDKREKCSGFIRHEVCSCGEK